MRQRYFRIFLAVFILLFLCLVVAVPVSLAMAIHTHSIGQPAIATPTPDANAILQEAQQENTNTQIILTFLNILIVVFPFFIALGVTVLGVVGFRGYRAFQSEAREQLGIVRTHVDHIKDLEKEAEQTKQAMVNTQTAIVYLALGDLLLNQKDTRQAVEAYKNAGRLLKDDPQINFVLGRIYSGAGYYEDAIQSFEAALAVQANFPEAEMELGLAYRRRGEYQQGLHAQARREGDFQKAREHLLRAIELRPNYGDGLSTLGGLYRRENNFEQALKYYELAYRAEPTLSYPLGNAASLAWYLGKVDVARRYYTLAEATAEERLQDPHSEIYWDYYDLALAQLVLGKKEDAITNYEKAIRETPGVVQFDSVLNVLSFLQNAKEPIDGLKDVIEMIEKEKATRIALG